MESQRVRHDWATSLTLLWSKAHKSEHWEWSQVDRNVSLVHRMFSIVFFFFLSLVFFSSLKKKTESSTSNWLHWKSLRDQPHPTSILPVGPGF